MAGWIVGACSAAGGPRRGHGVCGSDGRGFGGACSCGGGGGGRAARRRPGGVGAARDQRVDGARRWRGGWRMGCPPGAQAFRVFPGSAGGRFLVPACGLGGVARRRGQGGTAAWRATASRTECLLVQADSFRDRSPEMCALRELRPIDRTRRCPRCDGRLTGAERRFRGTAPAQARRPRPGRRRRTGDLPSRREKDIGPSSSARRARRRLRRGGPESGHQGPRQ